MKAPSNTDATFPRSTEISPNTRRPPRIELPEEEEIRMLSGAERVARARALMGNIVRIETGPNGKPARIIPRRGHRKPIGRYVSLKARRALTWESIHERHLMWICEADSSVVSYVEQPHRVVVRLPGRRKTAEYHPDLLRFHADGTKEVIEVKRTEDEVTKDPFYEEKLAIVKEAYPTKGFVFRLMTAEDDIEVEPIFSNAKKIQTDRFTRYGKLEELRFREAVAAAGGSLAYAKAIELLSENADRFDPLARARLHALVVRRVASIDIRRTLKPDSPVSEAAAAGRKRSRR